MEKSKHWVGLGGPLLGHLSRRGFGLQWLLLCGLLAGVGGLLAYTQHRMRATLLQGEQARLTTQVRVAEQTLVAQIGSVDAGLRALLEGVERWKTPDGFVPFAMEHLKRVERMMPGARTFVVLDSAGVCRLSNRPELVGGAFAHRDYFTHAMSDEGAQLLHVSPPYRTVLGVWAVTVSRTVFGPGGQRAGVVAATLSPDYFQTLMSNLSYAPDMRVSLVHEEGAMYVTAPPSEELQATDFRSPHTFTRQHLDSGRRESVYTGVSVGPSDQPRLTVLRTVALAEQGACHGFVAVASRDMGAILAEWHKENALLLLAFSGLLVLSAGSLALYQRWVSRLKDQKRQIEQALGASNARLTQLADTLPCVLFDFERDASGATSRHYFSPYSQTLLGVAPESLMDKPQSLLNLMHPDDLADFVQKQQHAFENQMALDCHLRIVRPDARPVWVQMTSAPSPAPGLPGVTLWTGFIFDVSERMRLEAELRILAYHDPLTGAHNRRSFMAALALELSRVQRTGAPATLLMLDVDHFKRVNDTWGHDAGDAVLKHLVTVLQGGLRGIDTLGRLGGEEFAVLLPATSAAGALELAERLRLTVSQAVATVPGEGGRTDQSVPFTVSVGLATLGASPDTADAVLKRADTAMYAAKSSGRNRVCVALSPSDGQAPEGDPGP